MLMRSAASGAALALCLNYWSLYLAKKGAERTCFLRREGKKRHISECLHAHEEKYTMNFAFAVGHEYTTPLHPNAHAYFPAEG